LLKMFMTSPFFSLPFPTALPQLQGPLWPRHRGASRAWWLLRAYCVLRMC